MRATGISSGARVLDSPCGAGRHSRAFAAAGLQVNGIDLSADLLEAAAATGLSVARADIRHLPFAASCFDAVVNLFSSFGYMKTDEQNLDVMRELARVCRPGGWLVIDFMNAPHVRANLEAHSTRRTASGCVVEDRRWISTNPERVNKETVAKSAAGEEKRFSESVRLFTRDELEGMMTAAGVEVKAVYGNYAGDDWTETMPRLILVGRRR